MEICLNQQEQVHIMWFMQEEAGWSLEDSVSGARRSSGVCSLLVKCLHRMNVFVCIGVWKSPNGSDVQPGCRTDIVRTVFVCAGLGGLGTFQLCLPQGNQYQHRTMSKALPALSPKVKLSLIKIWTCTHTYSYTDTHKGSPVRCRQSAQGVCQGWGHYLQTVPKETKHIFVLRV